MILRSGNALGRQPLPGVASRGANPPTRPSAIRQGNAVLSSSSQGGGGCLTRDGNGSRSPNPRAQGAHGDPLFEVAKCSANRCKTCPIFSESSRFRASQTGTIQNVVNPNNITISCKSQNVIYLLTCSKCRVQYVGETKQKLSLRLNAHRAGTKSNSKSSGCCHITEHFTEGFCSDAFFTVQIVEKIDDSLALDQQEKHRKSRERFWIAKLRTVFPYGLNARFDFKDGDNVFDNFSSVKNHKRRERGRKTPRSSKPLDLPEIFSRFIETAHTDPQNIPRFLRRLSNMPHRALRSLLDMIANIGINDIPEHLIFAATDLITARLNPRKTSPLNHKVNAPNKKLTVFFHNKSIQFINLPSILHNSSVVSTLPEHHHNHVSVVYKLRPPIRGKIFNYKDFVNSEDFNNSIDCDCCSSTFCDPELKHICTGDLRFIKNNKLRKLFSKGPNYREPVYVDFAKGRDSIRAALQQAVESWSKNSKNEPSDYIPWLSKTLELVDAQIHRCKANFVRRLPPKPVLTLSCPDLRVVGTSRNC